MTKVWLKIIIYSSPSLNIEKNYCWEKTNSEIAQKALMSDILVMSISFEQNHFHFLIYLNENQSIRKTTDILKSITLFKLKDEEMVGSEFNWSGDYLALSVSPSLVDEELFSINNQQQFHLTKSLNEEFDILLNEGASKYEILSTSDILSEKNYSDLQ